MSDTNITASVSAEDISLDARHMFLTKDQVAKLNDLPTAEELELKYTDMYDNLKSSFNDLYIQLLNMPDAVSKLKAISTLLQTDDTLNSVMNMIGNKVDREELSIHNDNTAHLTSDDRVGLNVLTQMIKDGGIDWNAEETSLGYIKNKPTKMEADGGNADTVGGYPVSKLINHREHTVYVGAKTSNDNNDVLEEDVDIYLDSLETYDFVAKWYGSVYFRTGIYKFNSFTFNRVTCSIIGEGQDLAQFIFNNSKFEITKGVTIRDITIKDADVYIGSSNIINRVTFLFCNIYMDTVEGTRIQDCDFINCTFRFSGSCVGNIITNNISNKSMPIKYIGGDNVIANNVRC